VKKAKLFPLDARKSAKPKDIPCRIAAKIARRLAARYFRAKRAPERSITARAESDITMRNDDEMTRDETSIQRVRAIHPETIAAECSQTSR